MKVLKLGSKDKDVLKLRNLLGLQGADDVFDQQLSDSVKEYQSSHNLVSDGIVGWGTWKSLLFENSSDDICWDDLGYLLSCDPKAIRAVVKVESGGSGGFFEENKPAILFEGHIFWKQLKSKGISPSLYVKGNGDILYPKWTKAFYKGGLKEYDRLNRAIKINREAALESISVGMFQIMGFNYKLCGCKSVEEYWEGSKKGQLQQVLYFCEFIKSSKLLDRLRALDWVGFAKGYNGPGYKANNYDVKLKKAYNSF